MQLKVYSRIKIEQEPPTVVVPADCDIERRTAADGNSEAEGKQEKINKFEWITGWQVNIR